MTLKVNYISFSEGLVMYKKLLLGVMVAAGVLYSEALKADTPSRCVMIKRYYQNHICDHCQAELSSWVQAAIHALVGTHNLSSSERVSCADDITKKIVKRYGTVVKQDNVQKMIVDELTEKTALKVHEYCRSNKLDFTTTEKVVYQVKADIKKYVSTHTSEYYKFGLPDGAFATYYNSGSLVYNVEQKLKIMQQPKTKNSSSDGFSAFISLAALALDNWLGGGSHNETTTSSSSLERQPATAPKKDTVKPSASTLDEINRPADEPKEYSLNISWAEGEKQCSICLEDYDYGDHRKFGLKCGHAICKSCRKIKGAYEIKVCPICRAVL